jgi:glycine/serine hydroxymethyltransferase
MKEAQMRKIAEFINQAISERADAKGLAAVKNEVLKLTRAFPLYPEIVKAR